MALAIPTPDASPPRRRRAYPPFTVQHWRRWASDLILDNGRSWRTEAFQDAFVEDLFAGYPECWFVVPEGNGKTTLLAGIALYHVEHRPFASVPVSAASREQAEILYRQAEGFVLRSDALHAPVHSAIQAAKGKLKTTVPRFVCLEGYRRINHHAGGRIQVFAADDRTGDGVIPTLGIIDEPHRQRDLSLYRTWVGKLRKRDGQVAALSTAGDPISDFEQTRKRILETAGSVTVKGAFTRAVGPRIVLHDWSLPPGEDPEDFKAVKAANPLRTITVSSLREKHRTPTMTPGHWLRFTCNRPMVSATCWLGEDAANVWNALLEPWDLVDGGLTWVGVDVGIKRDSTAVVAVQYREDGRLHALARIWRPSEDTPVDTTDVMRYLRELDERYDLAAIAFDARFFDVPAKMLEDEGLPMVEVPQSIERMTPAVGNLYQLITQGKLTHDGDPAFTAQILNAIPRFNERGFTLAKAKSRGRIDAAVALALACDRAQHHEPVVKPAVRFYI